MMAFATGMRELVSDRAGREIALWSVSFGAPIGTLSYSARVEGLADLQSIGATLMGDAEYHAKLAAGRDLGTAPPVDGLIDADPWRARRRTARRHGSDHHDGRDRQRQVRRGAAWGVEIAQYVEGVTGFRRHCS